MYEPWVIEGKTPWEPQEFWNMSWRDADRFRKWFVKSADSRIHRLEEFIQSTDQANLWRADGSQQSFVDLGLWFLRTIERRHPTEAEARAMGPPLVLNPALPNQIIEDLLSRPSRCEWVYCDRPLARSVVADIGTYMAESLRAVGPLCEWARYKVKNHVLYNHPVLLWPHKNSGFCAIREAGAAANSMIEGKWDHAGFAWMFEDRLKHATWVPMVHKQVLERSGRPVDRRCSNCGFSFAVVCAAEGFYCNHCGHLEAASNSSR